MEHSGHVAATCGRAPLAEVRGVRGRSGTEAPRALGRCDERRAWLAQKPPVGERTVNENSELL